MAGTENAPASGSVWYFIAATFVCALPMLLFPGMPWWARLVTIVVGVALVVRGAAELRREKAGPDRPGGGPPQL